MATFIVRLTVDAETFEDAEEAEAAGERSSETKPLAEMPERFEVEQEIQSVIKAAITRRGWSVTSFDTIM